MTMTVRYNGSANRALAYADKNNKYSSKALAKLASGLKITSAADDAASFSIGARMRVKLRALDQDAQNVQNGSSILRTAEGGIQGQIEILKTIREKVIDAANDSNTDEDRQTIQKELVHLYDEMESLAYGTDFNSKKPLIGDVPFGVKAYRKGDGGGGIIYDNVKKLANSELNIIPNNYDTLDGIEGPFDIFKEWSEPTVISTEYFSGGSPGKPEIISIDFSGYTDVSQLNNVGMLIQSGTNNSPQTTRCVFSSGGAKYKNVDRVYGIKSSITETLDYLLEYNNPYGISRVTRDGTKLILTTYNNWGTNYANVTGISDAGGTVIERVKHYDGAGIGYIYAYTSGGVNDPVDADDTSVGAPATLTVDLSGATHDSGFKFDGDDFRIVDPNETLTEKYNVITLTKGTASSGYTGFGDTFRYNFDGSSITFTATRNGTSYNGKVLSPTGYYYYTDDSVEYTAYTPLVATMTVEQDSEARVYDSWEMDLSGMTVDDFSAQYSGKLLRFGDSSTVYKFYDSSLEPRLEGIREERDVRKNDSRLYSTLQLDINNIRQRMSADSSLSLADALQAEWRNSFYSSPEVDGDKVRFVTSSNNETIKLMKDNLRHYDINFAQLDGKITMPDDLYGKGFQAYCASDPVEWFNFVFTDGTKTYSSSNEDIKSINIDVSNVHNSSELVQAIYDQATPLLTGSDPTLNHFMRVAADPDTGILTLYDNRRYDVNTSSYDYQEKGAKIADGLAFDVKDLDESETSTLAAEYFYGKDLVIQHTDKASMNIRIKIPQMTLDHIFAPLPDEDKTIFDYSVTDKASRDALLGNYQNSTSKKVGILDKGLTYLLDAATLVGAQNRRLEFTATNITTEMENLTASESVISDADMAKEMAEYTKANILAQAAQSMLAQANQSQSMILSLLG